MVVVQLSIHILVYCVGSIKYEGVLGEVEGTTVQSNVKLSRKLWLYHRKIFKPYHKLFDAEFFKPEYLLCHHCMDF